MSTDIAEKVVMEPKSNKEVVKPEKTEKPNGNAQKK